MSSIPAEFVNLGDFNSNLDTPSHHTETFKNILTSFGHLKHVEFPTHINRPLVASLDQLVRLYLPFLHLIAYLTIDSHSVVKKWAGPDG